MGSGGKVVSPQYTQSRMIECPCSEVFFGGARGGGKSFACLLKFSVHAHEHRGDAAGIVFRRTYAELEDFLIQSRKILPYIGFVYNVGSKTWTHPNGAYLRLRYLDRDDDAQNYQGHNYSIQFFDEAGNWPTPVPIDMLKGALRSVGGVQGQQILTGNPGGPGHQWLKARFIDPIAPGKVQHLVIEGQPYTRVFIPSKLQDNKILMKSDPGYIARLAMSGPDWIVKAWLSGDWNIVAGAFFADVWSDKNTVDPFEMPMSWKFTRGHDWGSSAPFCTLWAAIASGEQPKNGPYIPRGSVIIFAEDYGWSGKPNEGIRTSTADIARRVKEAERNWAFKVVPGPADSAIFTVESGQSIIGDFRLSGVDWTPCQKGPGSRATGWQRMRDYMRAAGDKETPGLYIFKTCRNIIRTVPSLPTDNKKPDDLDTNAEDHGAEVIRYILTDIAHGQKKISINYG